ARKNWPLVSSIAGPSLNRRDFLLSAAAATASVALPSRGFAKVPAAYDRNASPPTTSIADFIAWMIVNRGEDPLYLGQRFDRYQQLLEHRDLFTDRDKRAFLMTPREEFCL